MKKIVLLLMNAMVMFLTISCNKDNGKDPVGGEDVTDPFLNPGGTLLDNGVNIVGAWASAYDYDRTLGIFILDSKGSLKVYSASSDDGYFLDSKGILHAHISDFEECTEKFLITKGIKSMVELTCAWLIEEGSFGDYNRTINNKTGQFALTYSEDETDYYTDFKEEGTIKNINIDTYLLDCVSEGWSSDGNHWEEPWTVYFRRIKDFSD